MVRRIGSIYAARVTAALDLYEYQGKQLFKRFGIPVSDGTRGDDARGGAHGSRGDRRPGRRQGAGADGRPRQGGRDQARRRPCGRGGEGEEILGLDIRGHVVRTLWIESASEIEKEYYLSITFDRGVKKPLFMFTTQGGVEIEEVAENDPGRARAAARRPARRLPALAGPPPDLRRGRRGPRASRSRSPRSSGSSTTRSSAATRCSARSTR